MEAMVALQRVLALLQLFQEFLTFLFSSLPRLQKPSRPRRLLLAIQFNIRLVEACRFLHSQLLEQPVASQVLLSEITVIPKHSLMIAAGRIHGPRRWCERLEGVVGYIDPLACYDNHFSALRIAPVLAVIGQRSDIPIQIANFSNKDMRPSSQYPRWCLSF